MGSVSSHAPSLWEDLSISPTHHSDDGEDLAHQDHLVGADQDGRTPVSFSVGLW